MNADQQLEFAIVMTTVMNYEFHLELYQPLRLVVGGTAGSGKSYLIRCLVKAIRSVYKSNKAV